MAPLRPGAAKAFVSPSACSHACRFIRGHCFGGQACLVFLNELVTAARRGGVATATIVIVNEETRDVDTRAREKMASLLVSYIR